jgi:hypothetical protein
MTELPEYAKYPVVNPEESSMGIPELKSSPSWYEKYQ